jgi:hypothetical protein
MTLSDWTVAFQGQVQSTATFFKAGKEVLSLVSLICFMDISEARKDANGNSRTGPVNLLPTTVEARFTLLFSGVVHPWRSQPRWHATHRHPRHASPGVPHKASSSRHWPTHKLSSGGGVHLSSLRATAHEHPSLPYLDISTSWLGELARWGASPLRSKFNMCERPRFASGPFYWIRKSCRFSVAHRRRRSSPITIHTSIV